TDVNGCTATTSITVTQPTVVSASATATAIACNGGSATVSVTANGGTGPYIGTGSFAVTAGTYSYTVTDVNGCTASTSIIVNQPTAISLNASTLPICFGESNGSINLTVTGGIPAYQISWTGPLSGNPSGFEILSSNDAYNINDLTAGIYNIVVTDLNDCSSIANYTVTEAPNISATVMSSSSTCNTANGSFEVMVSGGTAPYNLSWTGPVNGDPLGLEIYSSGSNYQIQNLPIGDFVLTILDQMGCTQVISSSVTSATPLTSSILPTSVSCFGQSNGSILVTADGVYPGYNISWTGPLSGDPIGNEILNSTGSYSILNLPAGVYNISITDLNGCVSNMSAVVSEPTELTSDINVSSESCNGNSDGQITVTLSNGSPPYNISWIGSSNGNPIGDEVNYSGGNYSITNLNSGNYSILVTDNNQCSINSDITINPGISINAVIPTIPSQCLNGNNFNFSGINSTISSGSITSYSWNFGDGSPSLVGVNVTHGYSNAGSFNITLTVTDGTCADDASSIVNIINNPIAIASSNSPICFGDTLFLSGNYIPGATYTWSGPSLFFSDTEDTIISNSSLNMSGNYTLNVTSNGCSANTNINVVINPTSNPTINSVPPLCSDTSPFQLIAASSGGTWSGLGITNSNTGVFDPNAAGIGTVTISYTSSGLCVDTDTQDIVINALPSPTFTSNSVAGCAPFTTTILNTTSDPSNSCTWLLNGLPAGNNCSSFSNTFTTNDCFDIGLTVIDNNGCIGTNSVNSFICTSPPPVAAFTYSPLNPSVNNTVVQFADLSLGAIYENWTIMNMYQSSETPLFTFPNEPGEYDVCLEVTNAIGCSDQSCATVSISDEITVFVPNCFTPNSDNRNEYFIPSVRGNSLILDYEFNIFNRWGDLIFTTTDPNEGWIGNCYGGELFVPDGVYVWQLKITPTKGLIPIEKTGNVLIIR
ncbi:MAG: hypothetical protein RL664_840, partial [Bacteroidota bacterium]